MFFLKEEDNFSPQLLGVLLEEFLNVIRKKREAQLYRNEVRHIFTAFDRHCKSLSNVLILEIAVKAFTVNGNIHSVNPINVLGSLFYSLAITLDVGVNAFPIVIFSS